MLLTTALATLLSVLPLTAAPATPAAMEPRGREGDAREGDVAKLTAVWERDVLVLTGIEPGANLRVYDVVGHVLADFRSWGPSARLRLARRQLVAVCARGQCVGAR